MSFPFLSPHQVYVCVHVYAHVWLVTDKLQFFIGKLNLALCSAFQQQDQP